MDSDKQEQFTLQYQAGKEALERGQYRRSVEFLEVASQLVVPSSRLGGEVQMWLVTAYQAAGRTKDAIALCRKLTKHPHLDIRKQGKDVLYILEAPQLKRPQEWMTQIPDLTKASESNFSYRQGTGTVKKSPPAANQPLDLIEVETEDNRFILVALLAVLLILGGVIWLSGG